MDVVKDVSCTSQSVITLVVLRFLWQDVSLWITVMSYDKGISLLYMTVDERGDAGFCGIFVFGMIMASFQVIYIYFSESGLVY